MRTPGPTTSSTWSRWPSHSGGLVQRHPVDAEEHQRVLSGAVVPDVPLVRAHQRGGADRGGPALIGRGRLDLAVAADHHGELLLLVVVLGRPPTRRHDGP